MKLNLNLYGTNYDLTFFTNRYLNNDNTYIGIMCKEEGSDYEEPWGDLSINLDMNLPENLIFINHNCNQEIVDELEKQGLIEDTGCRVPSGFVNFKAYDVTKLLENIKENKDASLGDIENDEREM